MFQWISYLNNYDSPWMKIKWLKHRPGSYTDFIYDFIKYIPAPIEELKPWCPQTIEFAIFPSSKICRDPQLRKCGCLQGEVASKLVLNPGKRGSGPGDKQMLHFICRPKSYWPARQFSKRLLWKIKWSHFNLISWVTGGTKFRPPKFRVIGKYLRQIDSLKYFLITRNPGSNFRSASASTF